MPRSLRASFFTRGGNVTALAATYATGTVRVLYRPWAKATLCHLTTHYVYSSPFPPLPSSSFLSFRSSQIAQSYEFRRRPLLFVKCILAYLVGPSHPQAVQQGPGG